MKKIIILTVLLILLGSLGAAAETTITFSAGQDATGTTTELIELFEKENPDINVEYISMPSVPNQQYDRYVTMFASQDSSIDVLASDIIWISQFAAANWIENISDDISTETKTKLLDGPLEANTYKGDLYGLPWYTDAHFMYYRKDLLDKYGYTPPETWTELINQTSNIIEKENNSELKGITYQAAQIEGITITYLEFLRGAGGRVLDDMGNFVLDDKYRDNGLEALQMMNDLIYKYNAAPKSVAAANPNNSKIMFQNGKAIFMLNWPFAWAQLQSNDSLVKDKVGIAKIPHFEGHPDANTSNLGGWQVVLNKFSENKEEAIRFMEFLIGYEAQKKFSIDGGHLPVVKEVYDDKDVLENSPYYKDLFDVFMNAFPRPTTEQYPKLSSAMQSELNATVSGVKDVEEAYNSMLNKMSEILE